MPNQTPTPPLSQHLAVVATGNRPPQELRFDPQTGELRLERRDRPRSPDAMVIDQIAESGFFAGTS